MSKYSTKSRPELEFELLKANNRIRQVQKKLKPPFGSAFWSANAELLAQKQDRVEIASRLGFLKHQFSSESLDAAPKSETEWHQQTVEGKNHFDEFQALEIQRVTAEHQAQQLSMNPEATSSFARLFMSSRQGFNIETGVGRRDSTHQSNFVQSMMDAYCPVRISPLYRWDPVLGKELSELEGIAAHLYPWHQVDSMDAIFGDGARDEIFSPKNGLFLHTKIEKGLDQGLLAIVPNVELEPDNPASLSDDQDKRQQRLRNWEAQAVKDYKVIILDQNDRRIDIDAGLAPELGIRTLADLHERKLQFRTDYRPRARYLWWVFLYGILRLGWKYKTGPDNAITREVNKATRYWGTRGRYVKRGMLLGFVKHIGHDVESILENSVDGDATEEPNVEAVTVAADEVLREIAKQRREEDPDADYYSTEEDTDEEDINEKL